MDRTKTGKDSKSYESVTENNSGIHFQIYLDKVGDYKWKLMTADNEVISRSEGHVSKTACIRSMKLVMNINGITPIKDV